MRVVVAPDSFKGSLSARAAAEALGKGLRRALPAAAIELVPLSDGGEGFLEVLTSGERARVVEATVTGPLGDQVEAAYGLRDDDGFAGVIEMAQASGLHLVPGEQRDPRRTTTYGTGELMRRALDDGARRLLVGIGGSATNDGGAGMAAALCARLLDARGKELSTGGGPLAELESVDLKNLDDRLQRCEVVIASDVYSPLLGERGASVVFGPQKGATAEQVGELDGALANFARKVEEATGARVRDEPGAGAAGGLGFGLMALAGASVRRGIDVVLDALGGDELFVGADLVVTAEGRIDSQTLTGKVPVGVARRAARHSVPVIAVGGAVEPLSDEARDKMRRAGLEVVVPAVEEAATLDELLAPEDAAARLESAAERVGRLLALGAELPS
ncbi:glycerate kinase [soil metagenome]